MLTSEHSTHWLCRPPQEPNCYSEEQKSSSVIVYETPEMNSCSEWFSSVRWEIAFDVQWSCCAVYRTDLTSWYRFKGRFQELEDKKEITISWCYHDIWWTVSHVADIRTLQMPAPSVYQRRRCARRWCGLFQFGLSLEPLRRQSYCCGQWKLRYLGPANNSYHTLQQLLVVGAGRQTS